LCWQRGGLVDLEGILLIGVIVDRRMKVPSDASLTIVPKSVASDKVQENPMTTWPTFEVVLYLTSGGEPKVSPGKGATRRAVVDPRGRAVSEGKGDSQSQWKRRAVEHRVNLFV
jgi:hypothetical protein